MKFIKKRVINRQRTRTGHQRVHFLVNFLLLTLYLGVQFEISAQDFESTAEIRQAAKIFLEEKQTSADKVNTEVVMGNIDPRLQLAKCASELDIFLPQTTRQTGKTTVGIRCSGPIAWKIFVSAQVTNYQEAWVANRNLIPGDILTREDLSRQRVAINDRRKVPVSELKQLENTSPRRRMRAGATIYYDSICLVCKGDTVSVAAVSPFLNINVEGIALSNAVLGEKIQVQNSKSKKVFDAIVTGKNQLNIKLTGSN